MHNPAPSEKERPSLLLVDDDEMHCWAMQRAFERRGYAVKSAHSVTMAVGVIEAGPIDYAVVDLRMPGASGLELIPRLKSACPDACIVVMTGYASISTAVQAIKLGASNYLPKPADADAIEAAFDGVCAGTTDAMLSVNRLAWEHIQRALSVHRGNISAAARALGMHRRTLQRKLSKHAPRV